MKLISQNAKGVEKVFRSLGCLLEWALDISELPKCSKDVLPENVAEHRLGELLRRHS